MSLKATLKPLMIPVITGLIIFLAGISMLEHLTTFTNYFFILISLLIALVSIVCTAFMLTLLKGKFTKTTSQTNAALSLRELKGIQEEKDRLKEVLERNQRLQSIGTLAGGIAHDFNNILYSIKGYTEMCQEDLPKDHAIQKYLNNILSGCTKGQQLVGGILTFSSKRRQYNQSLLLHEVIANTLNLVKPSIPASVEITPIITTYDAVISGDETQLEQVLINLINNATQAMNDKGKISIKLSRKVLSKDFLKTHRTFKTDVYFVVEVQDNGPGIAPDKLDRIFEPFFTTKPVGEGTGLGLSSAHGIIAEHMGEILVESQLGLGTNIVIYLPEQPANHKETSHGQNTTRRGRRTREGHAQHGT